MDSPTIRKVSTFNLVETHQIGLKTQSLLVQNTKLTEGSHTIVEWSRHRSIKRTFDKRKNGRKWLTEITKRSL